jgi:hypothetical protein
MSEEYEQEGRKRLGTAIEDSERTVAMLQEFVESGKRLLQTRKDEDGAREVTEGIGSMSLELVLTAVGRIQGNLV